MKPIFICAIVCIIASLAAIFVAVERYNTNANNVRAMNSMGGNFFGGGTMQPATPTATKYGIFFAIIFAGGAVTCLVIGRKSES